MRRRTRFAPLRFSEPRRNGPESCRQRSLQSPAVHLFPTRRLAGDPWSLLADVVLQVLVVVVLLLLLVEVLQGLERVIVGIVLGLGNAVGAVRVKFAVRVAAVVPFRLNAAPRGGDP